MDELFLSQRFEELEGLEGRRLSLGWEKVQTLYLRTRLQGGKDGEDPAAGSRQSHRGGRRFNSKRVRTSPLNPAHQAGARTHTHTHVHTHTHARTHARTDTHTHTHTHTRTHAHTHANKQTMRTFTHIYAFTYASDIRHILLTRGPTVGLLLPNSIQCFRTEKCTQRPVKRNCSGPITSLDSILCKILRHAKTKGFQSSHFTALHVAFMQVW